MYDGHNQSVGRIGEQKAAEYLLQIGYTIIECNANSRWGEIDVVAQKDSTFVFVEVKTRTSSKQGEPFEAVHQLKLRHLLRTIQYYVLTHNLQKRKHRLDVISIVLNKSKEVISFKHYENLKIDGQFRKW